MSPPVRALEAGWTSATTSGSTSVAPFEAGWTSATSGSTSVAAFAARLVHAISPPAAPPLSNLRLVLLVIAAYLSMLRLLHRNNTALRHSRFITYAAIVHNVALALASAFINVRASRAILSVARAHSWAATICTPARTALPAPIYDAFYLFYFTKFYELVDTFILVLRHKPLSLLHVWHHSTVILSVWGWLEYAVTIGVYGLWFNTFVHVFMYAYFACSLARIKLPFKRLITQAQIVQFLTGFASLIPFTWSYITHGGCTGLPGLAVTAAINLSYLALFLRFYAKSYNKPTETAKTQ